MSENELRKLDAWIAEPAEYEWRMIEENNAMTETELKQNFLKLAAKFLPDKDAYRTLAKQFESERQFEKAAIKISMADAIQMCINSLKEKL